MNISSEKKTILILSDVHQDINRLNKILAARPFDVCCILGDFFDSRVYDTEAHFFKTCNFVIDKLNDDKFQFLLGNHDQHYIYENKYTFCSGFSDRKLKVFKSEFKGLEEQIKDKFKWFFRIDDRLSTHAGLHPSFIPPFIKDLNESLDNFLTKESKGASSRIRSDDLHWMYGVGRVRKGWANFGGINWLDFNEEYEKISGLDQIFGHTNGSRIRKRDGDYCIDCNLSQWLEIINGRVAMKSFYDL